MTDKTIYYALMAVQRSALSKDGEGLDVVRFKAKGAREIKIVPLIKTFIYRNPVLRIFCIHEIKCGLMIGCGSSEDAAILDTQKFFRECNEKMFFVQAEAFGDSSKRPEIEFDAAMGHYKALRHITVTKTDAARN